MGVVIVLLLVVAMWVGIVAFDAYLFSVHVPTLIADPTNFGAWFWVVVAVGLLVGGGSASSKS